MKQWWRHALLVLVLLGAAILLVKRRDLFAALGNLSLIAMLVILGANLGVFLASALRFKVLSQLFALELSPREWLGLTAVTVLYTRLLPARLGVVPRALYLKKEHDFAYASYLSLLVGINLLNLVLSTVAAVAVCLTTDVNSLVTRLFVMALFVAVLGGLVVTASARFSVRTRWPRVNAAIARTREGFVLYARNPGGALRVASMTLLGIVARVVALYCCFWGVGADLPLQSVLLISLGTELVMIVSLTPGNLGITEGAIASMVVLLGGSLAIGASAAAVSRLAALLVQVVLGVAFSLALFGRVVPRTSER